MTALPVPARIPIHGDLESGRSSRGPGSSFRRGSFGVILGITGGGLRSHDAATGFQCPGDRFVTSNVGQNYPYTSETEAERAARIAKLLSEREGLADQLAADATPLDSNERWWVWKCPTQGCAGL